jgi:NUMOD4 motif.
MIIEEWKPIKYYFKNKNGKYKKYKNEMYEVSNLGNVRNIKTGKIRKLSVDKKGYLYFSIKKKINGKNRNLKLKIHRLVAFTFLKCPIQFKKQVNHIDGNKKNNSTDNLEWCSQSKNILHAINNGLMNIRRYDTKFIKSICECVVKYNVYKPRIVCQIMDIKYEKHYKELINGIINGNIYNDISSKFDLTNVRLLKINNKNI